MNIETLCPIHQHPELAGRDPAGLQQFANTLQVELHRNWDGRPATSIEDAWRIRAHLDAERTRAAEADNARREQAEAETTARLAPLHRRIDLNARRIAAHAAIDAETLVDDERRKNWENELDERGAALFITPAPPHEVDTRSPLERLKGKEAAR